MRRPKPFKPVKAWAVVSTETGKLEFDAYLEGYDDGGSFAIAVYELRADALMMALGFPEHKEIGRAHV